MITTALVSLYVLPQMYLLLKAEALPDIVTEPIPAEEDLEAAATATT
jgi:hypothetical protein